MHLYPSSDASYLSERQRLLSEDPSHFDQNWHDLFPEIIGRSEALSNILKLVAKIASSNSSVLILGESGTGKELIASAIHRLSSRSHKGFVAINCSAIPEDLLEAELFGHEKGAFTGADRTRVGHFGAADGGSIFLDEIGDMPARLQAKLLRVLQEKKYSAVGSNKVKEIDLRIIAATNKDLEVAVRDGSFRLDLYYRLNVLPILLPPLSERAGDVRMLLDHFVEQMNRMHPQRDPCWFHPDAIEVLCAYDWPGNIRQLKNLVERVFIVRSSGCIGLEDLPREYFLQTSKPRAGGPGEAPKAPLPQPPPLLNLPDWLDPRLAKLPAAGIDLVEYIQNLENSLILQALDRTNFNKNQAAKMLGLNRTTLVERIKKRGIEEPRIKSS